MKKIILPLISLIAVMSSSAQDIRLNPYVGYAFDDGFNVYNSANEYYHGKLKGGLQVGAGIEYLASPQYGVELLYLYKKSEAPATFKVGNLTAEKTETFDVTHNWIMLCGNSHVMNHTQKVEGTGGLMLGMLISDVSSPSTGKSASNTTFAWGAKLGVDIWASHKVALKLQSQILSSARATGGTIYYGYWGPVAVPGYVSLWQFTLGGGLVIRLGK